MVTSGRVVRYLSMRIRRPCRQFPVRVFFSSFYQEDNFRFCRGCPFPFTYIICALCVHVFLSLFFIIFLLYHVATVIKIERIRCDTIVFNPNKSVEGRCFCFISLYFYIRVNGSMIQVGIQYILYAFKYAADRMSNHMVFH